MLYGVGMIIAPWETDLALGGSLGLGGVARAVGSGCRESATRRHAWICREGRRPLGEHLLRGSDVVRRHARVYPDVHHGGQADLVVVGELIGDLGACDALQDADSEV